MVDEMPHSRWASPFEGVLQGVTGFLPKDERDVWRRHHPDFRGPKLRIPLKVVCTGVLTPFALPLLQLIHEGLQLITRRARPNGCRIPKAGNDCSLRNVCYCHDSFCRELAPTPLDYLHHFRASACRQCVSTLAPLRAQHLVELPSFTLL